MREKQKRASGKKFFVQDRKEAQKRFERITKFINDLRAFGNRIELWSSDKDSNLQ